MLRCASRTTSTCRAGRCASTSRSAPCARRTRSRRRDCCVRAGVTLPAEGCSTEKPKGRGVSGDGGYAHVRKYVRAKVQLSVQYSREDAASARGDELKTAEAIDLGGGGVRLATDE